MWEFGVELATCVQDQQEETFEVYKVYRLIVEKLLIVDAFSGAETGVLL